MSSEPTQQNIQQTLEDFHQTQIEEKKEYEQDPSLKSNEIQDLQKIEEAKVEDQNVRNEKVYVNVEENLYTQEQSMNFEDKKIKIQPQDNPIVETTDINEQNLKPQEDKYEMNSVNEDPIKEKSNEKEMIFEENQMKSSLIGDNLIQQEQAEQNKEEKSQLKTIQDENITDDGGLYIYDFEKKEANILNSQKKNQEDTILLKFGQDQNEETQMKNAKNTIQKINYSSLEDNLNTQKEAENANLEASFVSIISQDPNQNDLNNQKDSNEIQSQRDCFSQNQTDQVNQNGPIEETKVDKENFYCILKNILLKDSEEKIKEFTEAVKNFDEELMKNEVFQNQLKFVTKC